MWHFLPAIVQSAESMPELWRKACARYGKATEAETAPTKRFARHALGLILFNDFDEVLKGFPEPRRILSFPLNSSFLKCDSRATGSEFPMSNAKISQ